MEQRALSCSCFTNTYTYHVFLCFHGKDTRTGFTGNLYSALSQRGVLTFMDDIGLRKGEEIAPSLLNAIQKSRMAIIIFSKNYASSTSCLDELVQILECYTTKKMWVLPVFYDVNPAEVRHQRGSYGQALAEHERGRFKNDIETVQKWRMALSKTANLSGCNFKHGVEYEHTFIEKIIEEVSHKLNQPLLHIADYPVGSYLNFPNCPMNVQCGRPISENGWSYVEDPPYSGENMLQVQPLQEQFPFHPTMHPYWEPPLDNVYRNLPPGESSTVQDIGMDYVYDASSCSCMNYWQL